MKTKTRIKNTASKKTGIKPAPLPPTAASISAINTAIEEHLELSLTAENRSILQKSVSPAEFEKIEEILSFISNRPEWMEGSLSSAADRVNARLAQHYPFLSQKALFRIMAQATYGWR